MEPMTLFARIADPAAVARRLRELAPNVRLDGTDAEWGNAVVTFGTWWRKRTLTLTHDSAYYAEPNWTAKMNGMRGYFAGFPETERKERALMLPSTFRFSLGLLFAPDSATPDDPRLEIVYAIAELLDGIIFTPSSLRDARGRILFGAGGEDDEDSKAVWPQVIFEFSLSGPSDAADDANAGPRWPEHEPEDLEAPGAEQVARRALALTALTDRAILEQDAAKGNPKVGEWHQEILKWVRELDIGDELEPDEWAVIQRAPGKLDERMQIDSTWRLEGLVVLAWALRRFEVPPPDELVATNPLWESLGWPDVDAARALLADPTLRPRAEISTLRNRLFTVHWRLVNHRVHPKVLDFAEFARTCGFGPIDLTGLRLIDGDLSLGGRRIDRIDRELFGRSESAVRERHHAVNWLWEGPERYSDARSDT